MIESQADAILRHLRSGKRITPLEALNRFHCLRLSGRIYDLRQAGHDISMTLIPVGRNGRKHVAAYRLVKEAPARRAA